MPKSVPTDAISLLKADHRKVEGLFEQFEKARDSGRKAKDQKGIIDQAAAQIILQGWLDSQPCA